MKLILMLLGLLLTLVSPALAGLDLAWDDCATSAGVADIAFDCDGSLGQSPHVGYASFQSPVTFPLFLAMDFIITVQSASDPVPDFWQFDAGACNDGTLSMDVSPHGMCTSGVPAQTSLCSPDGGECAYGFAWGTNYDQSNQARFVGSVYRDIDHPTPLAAATNYFAFRFVFSTSGAIERGGDCAGCNDPVAIVFNSLLLLGLQPPIRTEDQYVVVYQPGLAPNGGCISVNDGGGMCGATPTRARTWGQVKSLYR